MVVVWAEPDTWRPFLIDIILLISDFVQEMTILCRIHKIGSSINMSFRVLEHIIVDVQLVSEEISQKYKT